MSRFLGFPPLPTDVLGIPDLCAHRTVCNKVPLSDSVETLRKCLLHPRAAVVLGVELRGPLLEQRLLQDGPGRSPHHLRWPSRPPLYCDPRRGRESLANGRKGVLELDGRAPAPGVSLLCKISLTRNATRICLFVTQANGCCSPTLRRYRTCLVDILFNALCSNRAGVPEVSTERPAACVSPPRRTSSPSRATRPRTSGKLSSKFSL